MQNLEILHCENCIDGLSFAALCFHLLDVEYSATLSNSSSCTEDLSSPVLKTVRAVTPPHPQLKALCIAQAQHAYFLKAKLAKLTNRAFAALEICCSELYKEVNELAKACGNYFPKGLVKHFELQSNLALLGALHYQGLSYMEDEETNAGILYRYGDLIDQKIKETRALMQSFRMEETDRLSAEETFKVVQEDVRTFYRIYRIYVSTDASSHL